MVSIATTGTPDNRRQANCSTEQDNPAGKQLAHGAASDLDLKGNDQGRHVDQKGCPQDPTAAADLLQTLSEGCRGDFLLLGQDDLLKHNELSLI
jgi:hypothetical protein